MANRVTTTIQARDETGGAFDSLDRRMRNSNLTANLMSSALTGTFGAALSGIKALAGGVTGALGSAADTQVASLSTAGDLMKMTGLGMTETTGIISTFRNEMSKTAASLAGDTKSYTDLGASIMDNLVPAFQSIGGEFDTTGFQKSLKEITKAAGLRAAVNGIDSGLAGLGISKFLGGASTSELQQLKFFESNPAVLAEIEKAATKMGVEIKDLTGKQRADILQQALSVPDDVMAAMTTSTSGIIEGFKSSLFDEQSGFFGMLRDVDKQLTGEQSVATGFNDFLKEVSRISAIFSELVGTDAPDIMRMAYDGLQSLTNWLRGIERADIAGLLSNIANPGQMLAGFVNHAVDYLEDLFKGGQALTLGTNIANLATLAVENMANMYKSIDYGKLGSMLGSAVNAGLTALGDFIKQMDWGAVGAMLYQGIKDTFILGATFLSTIDWAGLVGVLYQGIKAMYEVLAGISKAMVGDLVDAVTPSIGAIGKAVSDFFLRMAGAVEDLWASAKAGLTNTLPTWVPGSTAGATVKNSAAGNIPSPLLDAFRREQIAMPSGATPTLANTSELILNEKQQAGLMSNLASRRTSLSVGDIVIHAAPGMNEKSIANAVVRQLSSMVAHQQLNTARA
jgi:hypothetical protein